MVLKSFNLNIPIS